MRSLLGLYRRLRIRWCSQHRVVRRQEARGADRIPALVLVDIEHGIFPCRIGDSVEDQRTASLAPLTINAAFGHYPEPSTRP